VTGAESAVDAETAEWLATLKPGASGRDLALARLHDMLLRTARAELGRRAPAAGIAGVELDEIACRVADDALIAIIRRLATFCGEGRFVTWAYKFVILEVSAKLGRRFWTRSEAALGPARWEQLPARVGVPPEAARGAGEVLAAVQSAVDTLLSPIQRYVFVAILVHGIPADALATRLATNRDAIYATMFDARRAIHTSLVAKGYVAESKDMRS
jgi:RNA polymerase sigma-70 factor, ECF subfamily